MNLDVTAESFVALKDHVVALRSDITVLVLKAAFRKRDGLGK